MDGRIGALHIRYRIPASMPQVQAAIPGLERMGRTHLPEACEAAFQQVLGDSETVYVIRHVDATLAIASPASSLSTPLVRGWAERITGAATRVLARGDEGIDFIRFDDQADFVARFLVDLVQQDAGRLWFYGAFHRYLELALEHAIAQVLEDNRHQLNAILRRLRERGHLELILAKLTPQSAAALAVGERQEDTSAPANPASAISSYRPLLATALGIASALGAEVTPPPSHDTSWLHALSNPPAIDGSAPDWKDSIFLATCVADILCHLTRMGAIRWPASAPAFDPGTIAQTLAPGYDWLPLDWLAPRIAALWTNREHSTSAPLSHPIASTGPTPRQKRFLDLLLQLATGQKLGIDPAHTDLAPDVLRIRSVLASVSPEFADDQPLLALLEAILLCRQSSAAASPTAPDRGRAQKIVNALGASAQAVVKALNGVPQTSHGEQTSSGERFSTSNGALFLLTRGVIDLRIDSVLKSVGVASSAAFRAALAKKFGPLDDAARLWAAFDGVDPFPELSEFPCESFHQALFSQAVAQRHLPAGSWTVEEIDWRGDPVAVAGHASGIAWTLASFGSAANLIPTAPERVLMPAAKSFHDSLARLAEPIEGCSPPLDLALTITAACVVRAWSRWLRGIGDSTAAYLLRNTLDRAAEVQFGQRFISVRLTSAPLDSIVELAGYFAPLPRVPWLQNREIRFLRGTL